MKNCESGRRAPHDRGELVLVEAALARVTRRAELGVPWQGAAEAEDSGAGDSGAED